MKYVYGRNKSHLLPQLHEIARVSQEEQERAAIPATYRRLMHHYVSLYDAQVRKGFKPDPKTVAPYIYAAQSREPLLPRMGFNPNNGRIAVSLANVSLETLDDIEAGIRVTVGVFNSRENLPRIAEIMPEFTQTQVDLLQIQSKELADLDEYVVRMPEI